MPPTERLASFASSLGAQDLPQQAIDLAKAGIMDYLGVVLAGLDEKCSRVVRRTIAVLGGTEQAFIWGTDQKTSVTLAALANGTSAHALDLDDVNMLMIAHPSIQLLPGLFALGELNRLSGLDIITAYVAGFEIGAKLGRALQPNHVGQGWFPVGTIGPLMHAAACARLLNLSPKQTQMALGLAANSASGLRCNNGTMAKPYLAGHAADSGIMAALLAQEGMTANPRALEDQFGYIENFSRGSCCDLENALETLGNPLDIVASGLTFKLYPCCAGAHSAIACALEIARNHSISQEDIKDIQIMAPAGLRYVLIHPQPRTINEARFSLEYCVARAILDLNMGPKQFTLQKIEDPLVQALMAKISIEYHQIRPMVGEPIQGQLPIEMNVRLKTGDIYSQQVKHAKGTPQNPLSWQDLEEKFKECCSLKLSNVKIQSVLTYLKNIENIQDISVIASTLL